MDLHTPLTALSGIGYALHSKLRRLNLLTVGDLIGHYPFRYEDFTNNTTAAEAKVGEVVTIKGEIWSIQNTYTRNRKALTQAVLNDGQGTIEIVWFNQPYLTKNIKVGDKLQVSGKVGRKGNKINLVMPVWEKVYEDIGIDKQAIHTGTLSPVYPETYGLTSKWFRQKIDKLLPIALLHIKDPLPDHIRAGLLPLHEAVRLIHQPKSYSDVAIAKKRLAFDELFFIQLNTQKKRAEWKSKQNTKPLYSDQQKLNNFINELPFKLTESQEKVIGEVVLDLAQNFPMNRLLQGEVGSGKTVVAAAAAYISYINNMKSIIMAPTEILVSQHFNTLNKLLKPFGVKVGLYTGSKKFTKNSGEEPDIIVGTHALLSEKLKFEEIGLIVIDEQQRFGVKQRAILRQQAQSPHFLTMTATPIPRTVALTLYGDLDLSIITQLPTGRKPIKTYFVPNKKRADAYKFIEKEISKGRQAYIITPLIEESETNVSAKAAKVEHLRLSKDIFPSLRIGLLHGRLKAKEKDQIMDEFKEGKIDVLVSTSVVEVGVDVPNATVMVIEGAERFGLAQLHQLRGRVGRGTEQSYTLLFAQEETPQAVKRIQHLETIDDGLRLAELDMKIRGSGEVFGLKQSGHWDLKVANFFDLELIEATKNKASQILSESLDLDKYPLVAAKLSSEEKEVSPD